jgi:multidrug efflux pump subunit AcrB
MRAVPLVVTGEDRRTVGNVASELANEMKPIALLSNITTEIALDRPELRIRPRTDLAVRLGVATETLAETVRVATIGDAGPALATFNTGDRLIPIRVQLEASARANQQILEQLRVPAGRGGSVPLVAVADIQFFQGPASINRYDRERQATVAADLAGNSSLGDAMKRIEALPVKKNPPKGIKFTESADAERMNELGPGFMTAMRDGLLMVYAVLVLLFGSFLQPVTILFSLPLSIGGAILALLITGKQITIPVYIGMLMLMGIVTKNAILLVDFAIESIHHGMERDSAIIDAGRKRARPIIMTTIAMIAGMLPSALAYGAGGEFRSPMAIAVIGGLAVSTALSLIFVPAMFTVVDDVGRLASRLGHRLTGSKEAIEPLKKGPPQNPEGE